MDVDDEIDRLWQMLSNSSRRWALPRESPPCKCHSFERVSVSMRLFTDKGYSIESIECVGDEIDEYGTCNDRDALPCSDGLDSRDYDHNNSTTA